MSINSGCEKGFSLILKSRDRGGDIVGAVNLAIHSKLQFPGAVLKRVSEFFFASYAESPPLLPVDEGGKFPPFGS